MLCIDIGNTRIKLRIYERDDTAPATYSVPTHPVDALPARLAECADSARLRQFGGIFGVSVCSAAERPLELYLGASVKWIGRDFPLPVPLKVDRPEQVGPDRVLAAFAAHLYAGGRAVCVGCGTAITVDVAAADGAFLGGAILPGLALGAAALSEHTERLPRVEPRLPLQCPAGSTESAVNAGLLLGAAGGISRVIEQITLSVGPPKLVMLTGGAASLLQPLLPDEFRLVPDLVLEGLLCAVRKSDRK